MSITILPRRRRHHPTMQPLQLGRPRRVVNVRISSSSVAIAEYRAAAVLLRDLNMEIAARFLEVAANAITNAKQTPVTVTDDDSLDTVVADVPLTAESK